MSEAPGDLPAVVSELTRARDTRRLAVFPAITIGLHGAFRMWPDDDLVSIFWLCNLANVLLGLGLALRLRHLVAVALIWLVVGTGAWLIDIVATQGREVRATQFLTHVVGTTVAFVGARRLGMPRGAWWRALVALMVLQLFCRFFTDPRENMNASHEIYGYYKKIFASYWAYWSFMTTLFAGIFFLVERAVLSLDAPSR